MCTQVLKEKMDVMRLTFYTAPVSVGILVPFFLLTELKKLLTYGCAFTTAAVMHAASPLRPPCTCPWTNPGLPCSYPCQAVTGPLQACCSLRVDRPGALPLVRHLTLIRSPSLPIPACNVLCVMQGSREYEHCGVVSAAGGFECSAVQHHALPCDPDHLLYCHSSHR